MEAEASISSQKLKLANCGIRREHNLVNNQYQVHEGVHKTESPVKLPRASGSGAPRESDELSYSSLKSSEKSALNLEKKAAYSPASTNKTAQQSAFSAETGKQHSSVAHATVPATGATEHASQTKSTLTTLQLHERPSDLQRNCRTLHAPSTTAIPKTTTQGKIPTRIGEQFRSLVQGLGRAGRKNSYSKNHTMPHEEPRHESATRRRALQGAAHEE